MKTFSKIKSAIVNRLRYAVCAWRAARIIRGVKRAYPNAEGVVCVNSWPPTSGTTTGYKATGVTTIQWGTDGLLQSPKPSGTFYIVTRFSERTLNERIPLSNGSGVTSTRVMIKDGVQWDVTVRDDSQMTPPKVNDTVVVTDAAGLLGSVGAVYTAYVIESNYEAAPKQAGERVLVVENLVLVDSQSAGSAV